MILLHLIDSVAFVKSILVSVSRSLCVLLITDVKLCYGIGFRESHHVIMAVRRQLELLLGREILHDCKH